MKEIRTWPPGLLIFGLMTPLPGTPCTKSWKPRVGSHVEALARVHSLCDGPYAAEDEHRQAHKVRTAWASSYGPEAIKGGGFPEPQAAGLLHQHLYRTPLFSRNLLSANGPASPG